MNNILTIDTEEAFLRQKSLMIHSKNEEQVIAQKLIEILSQEKDALGLAAPQIGCHKRVIAFKNAKLNEQNELEYNQIMVLFNPAIEKKYGEVNSNEQCLSIPGLSGLTKRSMRICISDKYGFYKLDSLMAIVVQHEIDHLDGILFIDRAEEIHSIEKEEPYGTE